jgi:hypothetical protein
MAFHIWWDMLIYRWVILEFGYLFFAQGAPTCQSLQLLVQFHSYHGWRLRNPIDRVSIITLECLTIVI